VPATGPTEVRRGAHDLRQLRLPCYEEPVEADHGFLDRTDARQVQGRPNGRRDADAGPQSHLVLRQDPPRDPEAAHRSGATARIEGELHVVLRVGEIDAPEDGGAASAHRCRREEQSSGRPSSAPVVDQE
jgi:hypothetical protein